MTETRKLVALSRVRFMVLVLIWAGCKSLFQRVDSSWHVNDEEGKVEPKTLWNS